MILLAGWSQTILVKPEFQSVNPPERIVGDLGSEIQIINDQNDNSEKYFSDFSIHKLNGNFYEWTEQAIDLTKQELEQRGGIVKAESEKKLYLSFSADEVELGSFRFNCKGNLSVKTNTGFESNYYVQNRTPGSVHRACGGAITLSVIELLNDTKFREFLANK